MVENRLPRTSRFRKQERHLAVMTWRSKSGDDDGMWFAGAENLVMRGPGQV